MIYFNLYNQFILNLKEESEDILKLKGTDFDEEEGITEWIDANNTHSLSVVYTLKAIIHYLFGKYKPIFLLKNV